MAPRSPREGLVYTDLQIHIHFLGVVEEPIGAFILIAILAD
jgi:hypothetical protein